MIKILLTTLCIAYLAIACEAKCKVPSVGVELDNNTASGVWYGHDIYGPPTIGDGSCFVTEWSVNNDSKIEVHDSWKDHGGKEVNVDSAEVDSETEEGVTSYTFNIGDVPRSPVLDLDLLFPMKSEVNRKNMFLIKGHVNVMCIIS
ncbi:unnamed protein product [Acanthoscelides obtectus]|uniref:Uncharacterized protein n=1 Tax=Acanthoscelides obtectus TaxID=200917 RepID=A0A9P0MCT7_ACAOB|nr:unnamed protein product [Acanthoscelides obtectus]CAK1634548.1 hypothetical protein AOBTE_LOCUS8801 [Acanthoscelides obtectus]